MMFHYVISMQKYKNTQLNALRLMFSAKVQETLIFLYLP